MYVCVCDCVCGVFLPGSSQQGAVYFTHLLFLLDGITYDMKFEPCSIFFFSLYPWHWNKFTVTKQVLQEKWLYEHMQTNEHKTVWKKGNTEIYKIKQETLMSQWW